MDVAGLDFWLHELAEVERNATGEAADDEQTWQNVFVPKGREGEEGEGAEEDGKREQYSLLKRAFTRSTMSIPAAAHGGLFVARPLPGMLLDMPIAKTDDGTLAEGDEDNGTNRTVAAAVAVFRNKNDLSARKPPLRVLVEQLRCCWGQRQIVHGNIAHFCCQ
ncbi:hypothetical protein GPALN_014441 [Globodera pallida]|nr:hypothetical protein GPALN_014441 [Globodera pallida]